MSGLNGITGNTSYGILNSELQEFSKFEKESYEYTTTFGKNSIATIESNNGKITVKHDDSGDKVYSLGKRDPDKKAKNNRTRLCFYNAIVKQFGGKAENIPESVRKHLKLKDYGGIDTLKGGVIREDSNEFRAMFTSGRPLDAERVKKVLDAIDKEIKANPERYAKELAKDLNRIMLNDGILAPGKMADKLDKLFNKDMAKYSLGDAVSSKAKLEEICNKLLSREKDNWLTGYKELKELFKNHIKSMTDKEAQGWFAKTYAEVFKSILGIIGGNEQLMELDWDPEVWAKDKNPEINFLVGKKCYRNLENVVKDNASFYPEHEPEKLKKVVDELKKTVYLMFGSTKFTKGYEDQLTSMAKSIMEQRASADADDENVRFGVQDVYEQLFEIVDDIQNQQTLTQLRNFDRLDEAVKNINDKTNPKQTENFSKLATISESLGRKIDGLEKAGQELPGELNRIRAAVDRINWANTAPNKTQLEKNERILAIINPLNEVDESTLQDEDVKKFYAAVKDVKILDDQLKNTRVAVPQAFTECIDNINGINNNARLTKTEKMAKIYDIVKDVSPNLTLAEYNGINQFYDVVKDIKDEKQSSETLKGAVPKTRGFMNAQKKEWRNTLSPEKLGDVLVNKFARAVDWSKPTYDAKYATVPLEYREAKVERLLKNTMDELFSSLKGTAGEKTLTKAEMEMQSIAKELVAANNQQKKTKAAAKLWTQVDNCLKKMTDATEAQKARAVLTDFLGKAFGYIPGA